MRITTNYESPLVLKNIMITDGIFKRTEDSLENVELRVNVAHNIEQLSEVEYKITLELSVADPEGKLSVFVKGCGDGASAAGASGADRSASAP